MHKHFKPFKYSYRIDLAYTIADVEDWADGLYLDYWIGFEEIMQYTRGGPLIEAYFQTNNEDAAILFKLTWIR